MRLKVLEGCFDLQVAYESQIWQIFWCFVLFLVFSYQRKIKNLKIFF